MSLSKRLQDYVRLRDGGLCVYCNDAVGQEVDHVLPEYHKGKNITGNLVLSCRSCNRIKKGTLHEIMMAKAFKHLLSVGESLDWVDKLTNLEDENE